LGEIDQAIEQFKLTVGLEPTFDEARNNLASALRLRRAAVRDRLSGSSTTERTEPLVVR
jgi:hypothetical protein